MLPDKQQKQKKESGIIDIILFRYMPYWPLFIIMLVISLALAWSYLQYTTPLYQATATLMVKDEKKGTASSAPMEELNIYNSKKIVDNEIEVVRSRAIMNEAVKELHLYAPISEAGEVKTTSAYESSPIVIETKSFDKLPDVDRIYFKVNDKGDVVIDKQTYPLYQWVATPYGELMFKPNDKKIKEPSNSLFFKLVKPESVSDSYLSQLQVTAASKLSTVIYLTLKDEVPKRAEDLLNKMLEIYSKFSIKEKNKLAANTLTFVTDRLRSVEQDLDSMEKSLQRYKSRKQVIDLSEQGRLYLQNIGENDRRASELSMQLAVLDQVEKYVVSKDDKAGIAPSTLGNNDPILTGLLQKLRDAELQYESLRKTTAENNPMVVSLSNQIESLRPTILENIRSQKTGLLASKSQLSNATGTYNSMLLSIPQKERELLDLSRQQIIKNNVYTFLLQKREETALSYASTVADSWVVDNAKASGSPVSPNKMIIYLAAIFGGLVVAAAFITMKELFNRKVLFRSEIEEATKVPVAAEILYLKGKNDLVITQDKGSMITEQFRQLRAAIGMYGKQTNIKKLLVTSSISGEGKSFVSSNLALSLAYSGKKVILVDLDLRNPKASAVMDVSYEDGVAEFLEGNIEPAQIIHTTLHKNLFVIGAGGDVVNPTELLLNGKIAELFEYLEDTFDYIVVDTTPVDPVTDAYVLSEYCDTTLFVVRHGYTPKTMIQMLDDNNKIKALKNVFIVFNGVRSRGFLKGNYGYGYGYGYEYVYSDYNRKKQAKKPVKG
jgi:tyrosine-protein kinase Etk/Wzc